MMAHQDSDNQANMENMVSIPTNNQTIATSVKPEPPVQTMSDVTNVLKCIEVLVLFFYCVVSCF
jgi:hypothetical protein